MLLSSLIQNKMITKIGDRLKHDKSGKFTIIVSFEFSINKIRVLNISKNKGISNCKIITQSNSNYVLHVLLSLEILLLHIFDIDIVIMNILFCTQLIEICRNILLNKRKHTLTKTYIACFHSTFTYCQFYDENSCIN